MEIKYIDIHSHLGFADFGKDTDEVIKRMKDAGVMTITVGTDLKSSIEAVKLAEANENIWACIGAHPEDKTIFFDEKDFAELVKSPKVVAIGECGLDYFRLKENIEPEKARQKKEFIKQIEFAIKYDKPLMLHIRPGQANDAYKDAYEILHKYKGLHGQGKARGNVHFFAGDLEWGRKFFGLGFSLSFTGVITFADQYDEVIRNIPLDSIHAETDSPYVAPVPYRGKRNEPSYVAEVVKRIAELRGEDVEKVRKQLLENAQELFNFLIK